MADTDIPGVLLDHARDKVALLDAEGRFTYLNDATERVLGYAPAELLEEDAFAYVHPEDVEAVRAAFERTIASEDYEETTSEYRFRAADGSWVWLESRLSNLTDERLDGYVVSSRAVTDRVEAQRERRETICRFDEISATTGEVLWMFDGDWSDLLFVNPAYETVYGGSTEGLADDPTSFLDAVHPDDVEAVEAAMERLSAGESADLEYRVGTDEVVWVWAQGEPIVEDGEVVRIVGFSRDVTDRHRRRRQLYVMDNLLRHNLRNDMDVILGTATRIEKRAPETSDLTAIVRRTGEDLLASVEKEREVIDLLRTEPAPTRVDAAAVVEEAVVTVRDRYPEADLSVSAPECAPALGVETLPAAVVELVENAVVHATGRPSVEVVVERADGETVVVVADDGDPIPDVEARVLVGDHEMTDVYHSSGLGLWLVYWTAELSGGRVAVEYGEGGSRVRLCLPAPED